MNKLSPLVCLLLLVSCKGPFSKRPPLVRIDTVDYTLNDFWERIPIDTPIAPVEHSSELISVVIDHEDVFEGFGEFFTRFEKPEQTYLIHTGRDTILYGSEGTSIEIPANSFSVETGDATAGKLEIKLKEYYQVSDMLLANLSTTSNNQLLETGGMIHLEAFVNGQKCELKKGETLEIAFPTKTRKNDMRLFSGQWSNEKINWKPMEVPKGSVILGKGSLQEFPGGNEALGKYLRDNLQYPKDAFDREIQGKVWIEFSVSPKGEPRGFRVARGVDTLLDQAALAVVSKMPNWSACQSSSWCPSLRMMLPVTFKILGSNAKSISRKYQREFESSMDSTKLQSASMSDLSQYLFRTSQLGWINCDRFIGSPKPRINYFVEVEKNAKVDVKLVFKSIRSILTGQLVDGKYQFLNVPEGEPVTLVALKYEKGQYYLDVRDAEVSNAGGPAFDFEPVTMDQLKKQMKRIRKV